MSFEYDYFNLVGRILNHGAVVVGRNGATTSLIGETLKFDLRYEFPILKARAYPVHTVFGEFAAIIRGPKYLEDFLKYGCGYWAKWANQDASLSIDVDYGNAWLNFNGVNQLEWVANEIKTNPQSRRLIVSGWNPANVINNKLSLPCCHYSYQFVVRGNVLHMIWIQRSADTMIGVPADAALAAAWLIALANETGLVPGSCTMHFGDIHIYNEHIVEAEKLMLYYFAKTKEDHKYGNDNYTAWGFSAKPGQKTTDFLPDQIGLDYKPFGPKVNFLLKD